MEQDHNKSIKILSEKILKGRGILVTERFYGKE